MFGVDLQAQKRPTALSWVERTAGPDHSPEWICVCKGTVPLLILVLFNVGLTNACTLVDGVVYGVSKQIIHVL